MEEIKAWKPMCCKKAYMTKGNARRHEKKCPRNPENKACATCGHNYEESNTVYNPHHGGDPGSTDYEERYFWCDYYDREISKYGANEKAMLPQINCKHWMPKQEE